jgi:hypothetical protein
MSTSDATRASRHPLRSLEAWAVIAASALVLATVIGLLPRLPW